MIMINTLLHKNLAQARSTTKDDIADFVKKAYFDETLTYINRKVTLKQDM